jgi:hypothetical protein
MYIFKNKNYDTLLEAVDASYCDNNIYSQGYAITILRAKTEELKIALAELKASKDNYYDFEVNRIKTKDDLMREFEIGETR